MSDDKTAGWLALGTVVAGTMGLGAWLASRPAKFGSVFATLSASDLEQFLAKSVPYFIYKYLIQAGSLRQCGSISDAFATVAQDAGFEAYVTSRPGHFLNVVKTSDGVFEVDLSAIQFEFDRMKAWESDEAEDAELTRLMRIIAEDPFRAVKVRRIDEVPSWARPAQPEDASCFYTPVEYFKSSPKRMEKLQRGEYSDLLDSYLKRILGDRPYAAQAKPLKLGALSSEDMDQAATELERFLNSNPSTDALKEKAASLDVPPSQRSSRGKCIDALWRIIKNDREHATIARLASGTHRKA